LPTGAPPESSLLASEFVRIAGHERSTRMATLEASLLASEIVRILGVALYDHQDGGVILLDTCTDLQTGQNKVYNSAWEFVPDRIETDIVYPSLLEYVRDVMDRQRGFRRLDSVGDRADAVKGAG